MNIISTKIRLLLIILFLVTGYQVEIFAQEKEQEKAQEKVQQKLQFEAQAQFQGKAQLVDSSKTRPHGLYVGFSLASYQSFISQEGMLSVSGLNNLGKPGISGTVELGYSLSDHFVISSGITFVSLNNQVTLKTYQNKFNTTDTENETYERQVTGTNITEDQNIACLGIPVNLNLRIPIGRKLGFSLRAGIDMTIPVKKNYHTSGTFTYKGYYPKYNVLLENLPAYGFPNQAVISADGQLDLKPVCFDGSFSGGLDFRINKRIQAIIAYCYTHSLTEIQSYGAPEKFQLSPDISQINSMMGGSTKVNFQSAGVLFTLRFYLTRP